VCDNEVREYTRPIGRYEWDSSINRSVPVDRHADPIEMAKEANAMSRGKTRHIIILVTISILRFAKPDYDNHRVRSLTE